MIDKNSEDDLWPVERMSTYNSSCLYESDEMSLSDSNGTLYV